jgi:uncharacterized membrane protein YccF (DUF307 family)
LNFEVVLAHSFVDEKSVGFSRSDGAAVSAILVLLLLGVLLLGVDRVGTKAVCAVRILVVGIPLALKEELNVRRSQGSSCRLGSVDQTEIVKSLHIGVGK